MTPQELKRMQRKEQEKFMAEMKKQKKLRENKEANKGK